MNLREVAAVFAMLVYNIIESFGGSSLPSTWMWPGPATAPQNNKTSNFPEKVQGRGLGPAVVQASQLFTFTSFSASPVLYPPRAGTTPKSVRSFPAVIIGNCTCVPFYYCDEGQVVSDGNGVIGNRDGWPCRTVLEVCCRKPNAGAVTPGPVVTIAPPPTQITPTPPFVPQCGTLNPNGVHARVLGFKDSETQFGEYPWQAAILEQKFIAGRWVLKFICGGSLIWASVVLTAAHCVQGRDPGPLIVRLGEWDTQSTSEFLPYQDIWVQEVLVHPQYYSGAYVNDIAIVFLQAAAVLSPHIDTICLPWPNANISYDGSSCWATGWGKSAFGSSAQYQAILHEVELPIVSKDVCLTLLRNTSLGQSFTFQNSYLCAGGHKGRDSCVGDGGGPLVCPSRVDPWRYVLAGITSWGIGCGTYSVPGVYTDVSVFTTWIQTQVTLRIPAFTPRQLDEKMTRTLRNDTKVAGPLRHI